MIGGKTNITSYPSSIHLESFWRTQLKIIYHRMNQKGEHSAKMKFSGLNTKLLNRLTRCCSKYHPGCACRSEQLLEVASQHQNDLFRYPTRLSVLRFPVSGQRAAGKLSLATAQAFLLPTN
jgi:hypothetical protein